MLMQQNNATPVPTTITVAGMNLLAAPFVKSTAARAASDPKASVDAACQPPRPGARGVYGQVSDHPPPQRGGDHMPMEEAPPVPTVRVMTRPTTTPAASATAHVVVDPTTAATSATGPPGGPTTATVAANDDQQLTAEL